MCLSPALRSMAAMIAATYAPRICRHPYRRHDPPRLIPKNPAEASRACKAKAENMIPRYSRPEMVSIWSAETRFAIWFEIEAHATTKLAELGVVPREAPRTSGTS